MTSEKISDKIYSVSQLNALSQGVLERSVGAVWVRGEISGLKTQPSGHVYFSLKDEKSVLSVALFKGSAMKNSVKLQEGKQILVFGEVGIYLPRGSYQMVAKFILDEGVGRLQQEFERLKRQLESEGLFAKERKIGIPLLPRAVAFITSSTGAVWQDFTRILARREWRGRAVLFPCRVQGAEAATEIVECLKRADAWEGLDLIVVGRGGGSLEDLWAFNDERVVRQVAAMGRPVISAVGHETDFTLCDFASDFRAETPSAAAELIAGHFNDARATADDFAHRLFHAGRRVVMSAAQRFGGLMARLMGRRPRIVLDRALQRLDETQERMQRALQYRLSRNRERLSTLAAQINGIDPQLTLRRGYAMVRDVHGRLIARVETVRAGQEVGITWADGVRNAQLK